MARKSIDFTRSLLNFHREFNSREREKRQNLSLDIHGATRSNLRKQPNHDKEDEDVEVSEVEKMKDVVDQKVRDDDAYESLKAKFTIQNNSLAKSNAVLTSKISDLEMKVGELINENMSLRKTKTLHDTASKQQLDETIGQVEKELTHKFDEIFQIFKKFRESEGLPINSQLEATTDKPIIESTPQPFSFPTTTSIFDSFDSETINKKTTDPIIVPDPQPQTIIDSEPEVIKPISKQNIDIPNPAITNRSNSVTERRKRQTISVFEDREQSADDLNKAKQIIDQIIRRSQEAETVPVVTKQVSPEVANHKEADTDDFVTSKSAESTPETANELERPRRPLRNRGEVNYKPLSLRGKMRRESTHLVDAVDENAYINYTIPTVKIESNNEKKRRTLGPNEISNKRKPLGNKTNTYNNNTQSEKEPTPDAKPSSTFSTDQLSVFDFEEFPSSQSKYIGKRKGGKTNRRYTTFTH
ncbi:hypothetical protein DFJ63DRAFT_332519 [Scheffersomyces coipomensis]|uniref:uncharacterized protein n=1 Tax=Scheffersomyces coipomensis TaxID=1788519 RepID=UPI00315CBBE5